MQLRQPKKGRSNPIAFTVSSGRIRLLLGPVHVHVALQWGRCVRWWGGAPLPGGVRPCECISGRRDASPLLSPKHTAAISRGVVLTGMATPPAQVLPPNQHNANYGLCTCTSLGDSTRNWRLLEVATNHTKLVAKPGLGLPTGHKTSHTYTITQIA